MLEQYIWSIMLSIPGIIAPLIISKVILEEVFSCNRENKRIPIFLLLGIIISCLYNLKHIDIRVTLMLYFVLMFVYYKKIYGFNNLKCVIISIGYLIIFILVYLLVYKTIYEVMVSIRGRVILFDYYALLGNKIIRLEVIVISNMILLFLIPIAKSLKLKRKIIGIHYIYVLLSIIGNLICIIILFDTVYRYTFGNTSIYMDFIMVLVSSILLLTSIFSVNMINKIVNHNKLMLENKVIREDIKKQNIYYLSLQESQSNIRQLYHDMKNHMICITNVYGNNEYINSINDELESYRLMSDTGNVVLDVIINDKSLLCKKYNIDFVVDIRMDNCNFLERSDICSIFSNMLDNAINACIKINENTINKKIKLRGTKVNNFFVIKCENSRTNELKFNGEKIITDKEDKFMHGIGISSMRKSVEKYNGNLEIKVDENKFIIIIDIPLSRF